MQEENQKRKSLQEDIKKPIANHTVAPNQGGMLKDAISKLLVVCKGPMKWSMYRVQVKVL